MKILVHHPSSNDGTSFYRGFGPLNALVKQYPDIEITDLALYPQYSWANLTRYDLVFLQRPASPWEVRLIKLCNTYNIPVWCDWDDNYFDIPESNSRKQFYTPYHIDCVRYCAKNADLVTVSTHFLKEKFSEHNTNVHIVPNALIQRSFSIEDSKLYPERDNLILWRGSDTHGESLEFYKEEIIKCMDETKDYVWGFFGFCPQFAIDHLPSSRIRIYATDGCIEYLNTLLSLRPRMMYVVHNDTDFNKSRSNIAWMEATYAGAVCLTPDTKEWSTLPSFKYSGKENFVQQFVAALSSDEIHIDNSRDHLIANYQLDNVNTFRKQLATTAIGNKRRKLPPVDLPLPFTNQEFLQFNKEHGWTSESNDWVKGQDKFADIIKNDLKATSVVDIGCGPGGLLESLIKAGVHCIGIDGNPLNKEFFDKRNPEYKHRFYNEYAQNVIPEEKYDLVTCVEVMEHIPDEVNEKILEIWRDKCKMFLFTSTPYTTTPEFDNQWGHINVKPTDHWIKFFEERGYVLAQRMDYPAAWALLFLSCPKSK